MHISPSPAGLQILDWITTRDYCFILNVPSPSVDTKFPKMNKNGSKSVLPFSRLLPIQTASLLR